MEREVVNNAFYDDLAEKWYEGINHPIALLRAENRARTPWIAGQISRTFPNPTHLLDIGCGGGLLTNVLAQRGHQVTGIDLSEESLAIAKHRDETNSVLYQKGDATALTFPDCSFEVVTSLDLLEHVEEPEKVVAEAARVLKPGGLFFFHTFNRNWLSYLIALKGVEWFVPQTPKNMHLYRLFLKPHELKTFCSKNNLNPQTIVGLVPVKNRAFWRLLFKREVDDDFAFKITSSLSCGYLGFAQKTTSFRR
ncbi:MAG: Ubiquinone biosynthesis O-methyltransferase [Chlamydiae bacterium]|nr:Ubiquinone biosynthesis O-methyltransferase [Chlamydiota bacterium]